MFAPLLLAAACLAPPAAAAPDRPNVVLMMADDLGWGDVGYHGPNGEYAAGHHNGAGGSRHAFTPHIDQLAKDGIRLERFYSASPVCSPTRSSVMIGRHPHRLGITHANVGHLPKEEETLAGRLGDAGYATGFFGKWHLGHLPEFLPTRNGFDDYYGRMIVALNGDRAPFATGDYLPLKRRVGRQLAAVDVSDGRWTPLIYNTRVADEKGRVTDDVLQRPIALSFGLGGLWVVDQGDVDYRDDGPFYKPGTGKLLLLKAPEPDEPPATQPS